ncbi:MAG: DUF433 domain-containing protein [Firmicutes bacterium]|nr:DUF433 domain-containing protein [Bacillota bacterium]
MTASSETLFTVPLYTFAEADRLGNVRTGTAKRWLVGYRDETQKDGVVVRPPVSNACSPNGVSFWDLIEVIVVGQLRKAGFSLQLIRRIHRNCQQLFQVERPFVSLSLKVGGREIFVSVQDVLVEVGKKRGQQAWTEVIGPFLEDIDYEANLAASWWPLGHDGGVLVDPRYGFGRPVISGKGVRTEIIREHFEAKSSIHQIAEDFNLTADQVEAALRFEFSRVA